MGGRLEQCLVTGGFNGLLDNADDPRNLLGLPRSDEFFEAENI